MVKSFQTSGGTVLYKYFYLDLLIGMKLHKKITKLRFDQLLQKDKNGKNGELTLKIILFLFYFY